MLECLRQTLCIWIDRHETVFVLREGWLRRSARVLLRQPGGLAGGALPLDGLREGLQTTGLSGIAVEVVLHDEAMRIWPVDSPANASRLSDFDAACAMRFEAIFDEPLHPWVWRASPQRIGQPFIACAIERMVLEQLQAQLRARRLHLGSLQARSVALWNRWHKDLQILSVNAWLGICTKDTLTLCLAQKGQVFQVRHSPLAASQINDALWLTEHVQREAGRLNQNMPDLIGLCGESSESWLNMFAEGLRVRQLSRLSEVDSLFGVTA